MKELELNLRVCLIVGSIMTIGVPLYYYYRRLTGEENLA